MKITDEDRRRLAERRRDVEQDEANAASEQLYATCAEQVKRALADDAGRFRLCPHKACRRSRRCVGPQLLCHTLHRRPLMTFGREQNVVDDVYWDVLEQELAAEAESGEDAS